MPSYATLDAIADACNPAFGALALLLALAPLLQRHWRVALVRVGILAGLLALVYLLRWFDRLLDPANVAAIGYSTHSGFALVACACIAAFAPRLRWLAWGLLAAYLGLVLWQGYHPLADLLLTVALLAPACWLLLRHRQPLPAPSAGLTASAGPAR